VVEEPIAVQHAATALAALTEHSCMCAHAAVEYSAWWSICKSIVRTDTTLERQASREVQTLSIESSRAGAQRGRDTWCWQVMSQPQQQG
jgi:hypothetical protein